MQLRTVDSLLQCSENALECRSAEHLPWLNVFLIYVFIRFNVEKLLVDTSTGIVKNLTQVDSGRKLLF